MNQFSALTLLLTSTAFVATGCIINDGTDNPATGGNGGATTTANGGSGGDDTTNGAGGSGAQGGGGAGPDASGWVFSMSNDDTINELLVYERNTEGLLTASDSLPTGGVGSGGGLGSQGALALSPDGRFLYAVNAGSNQLSTFRIYDDHLALVDLVDSGGERPVSVAASDGFVYVVNAGGAGVVQAFAMEEGKLTPTVDQLLSEMGAGPAQIGLSPDGSALIVTEKATNSLVTYWVAPDGSLSAPTVSASQGTTPFGFDFSPDGFLVVSEAFGGMDGLSAVSSYTIGSVEPEVVSASIPSSQTAACWLLFAGNFAYTTNTGSNNVSGYQVGSDGTVSLFDDGGVTADLGADQSPIDLAVSADDAFVYVLNGAADRIVSYAVNADGSLETMAGSYAVPMPAVGLVAQ